MAKSSMELLREWQEKQKRFEEAQEEYISAGSSTPVRWPKKVLTEEALKELDRLEKEVDEAEHAWRLSLQTEVQGRR